MVRFEYEHDDRLVTRAVREVDSTAALWRAVRPVVWLAVPCLALLALAAALPGTTLGVTFVSLMLLPLALIVAIALGWLAYQIVAPWWLIRRLQRLPHRRVEVVIDPERFAVATARERYECVWGEVDGVQRLATLWLVRLRGGARFVLPVSAVPPGAAELLAIRAAASGAGATSNGSR
jgi:hypothetical protein